jgi:hypothetical protein
MLEQSRLRSLYSNLWGSKLGPVAKNHAPAFATSTLLTAKGELWTHQKATSLSNAVHVLIAGQHTGGWLSVAPLMEILLQDPRCARVSIFAETEFLDGFKRQRYLSLFTRLGKEGLTTSAAYLEMSSKKDSRLDVVISTVTNTLSPATVGFFFPQGAKRFFIVDNWLNLGPPFAPYKAGAHETAGLWWKSVQQIFVNDELAAAMVHELLPTYPRNQIRATGTGQTESIQPQRRAELARSGREKLGVDNDEQAVLFLGDIENVYEPGVVAPGHIFGSFLKVVEALAQAATTEPTRKFVLLVRPHPADPKKAQFMQRIHSVSVPENLHLIDASPGILSIDEAMCVATLCCSVQSTENFRAPHWGTKGVFLVYPEMGKKIIDAYLTKEVQRQIRARSAEFAWVEKTDELVRDILMARTIPLRRATDLPTRSGSKGIADIILHAEAR